MIRLWESKQGQTRSQSIVSEYDSAFQEYARNSSYRPLLLEEILAYSNEVTPMPLGG